MEYLACAEVTASRRSVSGSADSCCFSQENLDYAC